MIFCAWYCDCRARAVILQLDGTSQESVRAEVTVRGQRVVDLYNSTYKRDDDVDPRSAGKGRADMKEGDEVVKMEDQAVVGVRVMEYDTIGRLQTSAESSESSGNRQVFE